MGGSVANNDPAADYPSAVLALDATIVTDRREIAADDYFDGLYSTVLEPSELLTRIKYKIPTIAGYAKFRNPASRYALAAAFIAKYADGSVRAAITGAGNSGVFRWKEAEDAIANGTTSDAIKNLHLDPEDMMGDMHASAEYRSHLVTIVTARALDHLGGVNIT
jgi:carbon-monoxide dehydrogenase medium subunit